MKHTVVRLILKCPALRVHSFERSKRTAETSKRHRKSEAKSLTQKKRRLPVVVQERDEHEEQGMLNGQPVHVVGAVVVDDHLSIVPPAQQFLALPGVRQIGQARLPQLQPPPVESVRAVHVDRSPHVVHVVQDERPAIEQHGGIVRLLQTIRQLVGGYRSRPLKHQLPLQRVALRAGARRKADRLQLATLRRGQQLVLMEVVMMMKMVVVAVYVGQRRIAVGAAAAADDAGPAGVQAALGDIAGRAAVDAAARRRARRHRGRRRRRQERGRAGWRSWLAQASVQHQLQVVS